MTLSEALLAAKKKLQSVTDVPELEAELLLAHVLKRQREYFYSHPEVLLSPENETQFSQLIARRLAGEPIAYIRGFCEFWSLTLKVTTDTLIPRPDTEVMVETVLSLLEGQKTIADLGTGSGAIALALAKERPHWQVWATDINEEALSVASQNAKELHIHNVHFALGSWFAPLKKQVFHAIISNPPYLSEQEWPQYAPGLKFEPYQALVSGNEGLDALTHILTEALTHLLPGGYLFLEHGFLQGEVLRALLKQAGYENIVTVRDLANNERITYAQKGKE